MSNKKTLRTIVLAGALALGSVGCGRQQIYNGKIGEDRVIMDKSNGHIVTVTRPNGQIIRYYDDNKDSVLDYIKIMNAHETKILLSGSIEKLSVFKVEDAQVQYNIYIKQIKENIVAQELGIHK